MLKLSPGEIGSPPGTSGVLRGIWGHKGLPEKSLESVKLSSCLVPAPSVILSPGDTAFPPPEGRNSHP